MDLLFQSFHKFKYRDQVMQKLYAPSSLQASGLGGGGLGGGLGLAEGRPPLLRAQSSELSEEMQRGFERPSYHTHMCTAAARGLAQLLTAGSPQVSPK